MNDARTNTGSSVFFENDRMKQIIAIIMLPLILLVFAKQTTALHNTIPAKPDNSVWQDGYAYGIDDIDWYNVVYKGAAFAHEHNASVNWQRMINSTIMCQTTFIMVVLWTWEATTTSDLMVLLRLGLGSALDGK